MYKRGPDGSEDRMVEALEGLLAKHDLDIHSKDNDIKVSAPTPSGLVAKNDKGKGRAVLLTVVAQQAVREGALKMAGCKHDIGKRRAYY
jgi:hypothetical protein